MHEAVNQQIKPIPRLETDEEANEAIEQAFGNLDDYIFLSEVLSAPRKETLEEIARFLRGHKVLEVGAGCGVLSKLLSDLGVDVIPTDKNLEPVAACRITKMEGVQAIKTFTDRDALLMSFIPTKDDTILAQFTDGKAFNIPKALKKFKGSKIVIRTGAEEDIYTMESLGFRLVRRIPEEDIYFLERKAYE